MRVIASSLLSVLELPTSSSLVVIANYAYYNCPALHTSTIHTRKRDATTG